MVQRAIGRSSGPNGPNAWGFDGDGAVISTTSFINGALRTTVFTDSTTLLQNLLQQHTDSLGVDTYSYDGNGNAIGNDPLSFTDRPGVSSGQPPEPLLPCK